MNLVFGQFHGASVYFLCNGTNAQKGHAHFVLGFFSCTLAINHGSGDVWETGVMSCLHANSVALQALAKVCCLQQHKPVNILFHLQLPAFPVVDEFGLENLG